MSGFEKTLRKHNVFDRTLKTDDPKKILIDIFRNWKSPEQYEKLVQQVSALTIENEKLKADRQLVVVPKFVAKWIECVKLKKNNAVSLLSNCDMPDDVNEWLFFQRNDDNINLIIRAWLDGYTVEKEKLYVLEFPRQLNTYVAKVNSNGVITHYSPEIYDALRLTGKEIKAIDERYWPFAVPVDEVTE